jgi:hypothetical protein
MARAWKNANGVVIGGLHIHSLVQSVGAEADRGDIVPREDPLDQVLVVLENLPWAHARTNRAQQCHPPTLMRRVKEVSAIRLVTVGRAFFPCLPQPPMRRDTQFWTGRTRP